MKQNTEPRFIRIQVCKNIPIGNIYLTTKSYLLKLSEQNLARLDIVAIINCEDEEIVLKNSDITQLSPKKSIDCKSTIALEVQGACKLIDEIIFEQKKSVMIFGRKQDNPFYYCNIYLCSFFIYFGYSNNFQDLQLIEDIYCSINIIEKKIMLNSQPTFNKKPFILNSGQLNQYTFYLDNFSIGELEKFIYTKFERIPKGKQWVQNYQFQYQETLKNLSSINSRVFQSENLEISLLVLKPDQDPIIQYCSNPKPISNMICNVGSFILNKQI